MLRRRPGAREFPVAGKGDDKERHEMPCEAEEQPHAPRRQHQHDDCGDRERLQQQCVPVRDQWSTLKYKDPGEQIKREGNNPKQGRGCDVGRNIGGDGNEESRWDG